MMLSLCMIVKNEESNLKRCLASVKDIVNEMIIVDTGSTDRTIKIAESYGARVFRFRWTYSFSDARNYSLKQAKGDWIMLMDADDEMEKLKPDEIRSLLDDPAADAYFFETISYIGEEPGIDAVKSMNLRLLKNNKGYYYVNPVHEQIYSIIMAVNPNAKIINKSFKVYHYGYLAKSIKEKNKRERNITLLEKELMDTPGYGFALYNLGAEYCAMERYEKALEYFEQAYINFNPKEGFAPVMIFKMVNCYLFLKRYEEAQKLCDSGLKIYPEFTDLEYIKGALYSETGDDDLAVNHYERCCEMGEAPNYLNVIVGAGTYRPLLALGEINFKRENFGAAVKNLRKCLELNPVFPDALILLAKAYCRMKTDDTELKYNIDKYIAGMPDGFRPALAEELKKEQRYDTASFYSGAEK